MDMDMLSRVFDILQRAGEMERIGQIMTIVYGVICVFGILNCFLGYRILRFWMMIFGFLIGAGAGFGVTYLSGVEDKMMIVGAMAGLGIVLAIVSFLVYRAGIFVLGFGIGISLSIYLVHPTSSFSFFLCILVGVGLGILAMRYAKGVIIIGTSILGGVLAGVSIAKIGGLEQFPYGVGMAVGIALLGMLIQFAINKDRYDDDDEEDEDDDEPEEEVRRSRKKKNSVQDRDTVSGYNGVNRRKTPSDRYSDDKDDTGVREDNHSRRRTGNSDRRNLRSGEEAGRSERYSDRRNSSVCPVQTVTVMEEIREVQTETVRQIIAAGHQQQVLQEEAEETVLRKAAEESRAAAVQRTATIRTEGIHDLQAGHIMTTGMTMMPTESVLILIIRKHQMHMEILKKSSSGNGSWILKIWLILKKTSLNSFGIMKIRRSAGIF